MPQTGIYESHLIQGCTLFGLHGIFKTLNSCQIFKIWKFHIKIQIYGFSLKKKNLTTTLLNLMVNFQSSSYLISGSFDIVAYVLLYEIFSSLSF